MTIMKKNVYSTPQKLIPKHRSTGAPICSRASETNWKSRYNSYVPNESSSSFYRLVILGMRREYIHTEYSLFLDYLMLNTDRGADNYMIKYCEVDHEKSLVDIAPSRSERAEMPVMSELRKNDVSTRSPSMETSSPYISGSMGASSSTPNLDYTKRPHVHIAAIDNSLSFPHEHPHGWRSYTYGWLYLPVSVIGRPFSEKTRNHFLPLLTSKAWWEETTFELEKLFAVDPDFHPKMFRVISFASLPPFSLMRTFRDNWL